LPGFERKTGNTKTAPLNVYESDLVAGCVVIAEVFMSAYEEVEEFSIFYEMDVFACMFSSP
jgi:hypothetical protein